LEAQVVVMFFVQKLSFIATGIPSKGLDVPINKFDH
jgi:hypothetical protein